MEHELWLTALFNDYLAAPANAILGLVGITSSHPERPWENWLTMELLVVALLMTLAAVVRASLSPDKPGNLQHIFEGIYGFIKNTAEEAGLHHPGRYMPYLGTLFIFILAMNLIGIIPTLESPTMFAQVPAGIAVWTFLYYNFHGVREVGGSYVKHFIGPVAWLAPLMIIIEIIGHFARPLSLTMRLYGNMFGGEQVTLLFLNLTYFIIPVIFMALHVAVSIVQAYVFMLLTTIYVSGATAHEH
jgi:F-type H+-transporting ATPase subunit a